MAGRKWLLVETLGGEPSVVGWGAGKKNFTPLESFRFSPRSTDLAYTVIVDLMRHPHDIDVIEQGMRVIADPLVTASGQLHGLQLWIGPPDAQVPGRPSATAWLVNLSHTKVSAPLQLPDIDAEVTSRSGTSKLTLATFVRPAGDAGAGDTAVRILRSAPGSQHQFIVATGRRDQPRRRLCFSCRMYADSTIDGQAHRVLRGVTQDLGPAENLHAQSGLPAA